MRNTSRRRRFALLSPVCHEPRCAAGRSLLILRSRNPPRHRAPSAGTRSLVVKIFQDFEGASVMSRPAFRPRVLPSVKLTARMPHTAFSCAEPTMTRSRQATPWRACTGRVRPRPRLHLRTVITVAFARRDTRSSNRGRLFDRNSHAHQRVSKNDDFDTHQPLLNAAVSCGADGDKFSRVVPQHARVATGSQVSPGRR